jgi:hypothetical protein
MCIKQGNTVRGNIGAQEIAKRFTKKYSKWEQQRIINTEQQGHRVKITVGKTLSLI